MAFEFVPIPREKVLSKEPIDRRIGGIDAWEGHRFDIRMDWNSRMETWILKITHVETDEEFVRSPACLMREYAYDPYIAFIFFDPADQAEEVTEDNLGRNVKLGIFPKEPMEDTIHE